jgi:hypothetical protein
VDVLQADDDALAGGNVDARDTSHDHLSMSAGLRPLARRRLSVTSRRWRPASAKR